MHREKNFLKKYLIVFLLFTIALMLFATFAATNGAAAQVVLAWDANDPTPDGYRLYMRAAGRSFDYAKPIWEGPGTTAPIDGLAENETVFFVVRAFVGTDESGDSNEVEYTPPAALEGDDNAGQDPAADPAGLTAALSERLDAIYSELKRITDFLNIPESSIEASTYCGNPDSKIFHKAGHWCGEGAIKFDDRQKAIEEGFRPCGTCRP